MTTLKRFGTYQNIWLYKSEPDTYSINDLESEEGAVDIWDGVRNHSAKKNMMSGKLGDLVLFYHSNNKKETGIVGVCEIVKESYDDPSAKDPNHKYYDPKWQMKNTNECRWKSVDVKLLEKWDKPVTLIQLKKAAETNSIIKNMQLFTTARLSVQKVEQAAFELIEEIRLSNGGDLLESGSRGEHVAKRQRKV